MQVECQDQDGFSAGYTVLDACRSGSSGVITGSVHRELSGSAGCVQVRVGRRGSLRVQCTGNYLAVLDVCRSGWVITGSVHRELSGSAGCVWDVGGQDGFSAQGTIWQCWMHAGQGGTSGVRTGSVHRELSGSAGCAQVRVGRRGSLRVQCTGNYLAVLDACRSGWDVGGQDEFSALWSDLQYKICIRLVWLVVYQNCTGQVSGKYPALFL